MRFYVDSCIWLDYLENRKDNFRPLGEWAFNFFKFCIDNRYDLLISQLVIDEVNSHFKVDLKKDFNLIQVDISKDQINLAIKIAKKKKLYYADILHAILAKENNAIMITRDKHFFDLVDIVDVKKPEDLI